MPSSKSSPIRISTLKSKDNPQPEAETLKYLKSRSHLRMLQLIQDADLVPAAIPLRCQLAEAALLILANAKCQCQHHLHCPEKEMELQWSA